MMELKSSVIEHNVWRTQPIQILELSADCLKVLSRAKVTTIGQISDLLSADRPLQLEEGQDIRLTFEIRGKMYAYLAAVFLSMAQSLPTTLTSRPLLSFDFSPRLLTLLQNENCATLEQLAQLIRDAGSAYVKLWMGWQTFVELVDKLAIHYESTPGLVAKVVNPPQIHVVHNSATLLDVSQAVPSVSQAANATFFNCEADQAMSTDESANENHWQERSVDVLNLSVRGYNALRRAGIENLGMLADSLGSEQILLIKNVGAKTQSEITERLQTYLATLSNRDIEPIVKKTDNFVSANLHWRELSIDVLGPSLRLNPLRRAGITTLGMLADMLRTEQFLSIRDVGIKTQAEISEKLQDYLSTLPDCDSDLPVDNDLPDDTESEPHPAWHSYSIDLLDLPTRLHNVLMREGCTTLRQLDLLTQSPIPPTHIDGIGWKSFTDLKGHLSIFLAGLSQSAFESVGSAGEEPGGNFVVEEAIDVSLQDRIVRWLSSLPERDYQVIVWRYGFDGEPLTLDSVGEKLGLTRERVRQIENKNIQRLRHPKHNDFVNSIVAIVASAFEQSGTIMTDDEISKVADQFAPTGISSLGVMRLLSETSEEFKRYNKAGVWVWGDQSEHLLDTQSAIVEVLKAARAPISQDVFLNRFQASDFYRHHKAKVEHPFLEACLRTHPNVEHREDGLLGLTAWAKHRTDDIIMALRQIGHPAHYTEIAELVNNLLPEDMQAEFHNIHAQMQRYPDIFVRVGQGTYGLAEWGLETAEFYSDIIERIFRECGHPLSPQQVLTRVCEERDCKETTVLMLLQLNDRFRAFPGEVYGLVGWRDDEFPDQSYREKRLIATIADSAMLNRRKPPRDVAQALQDVDALISSARSDRPFTNQLDLFSLETA